MIRATVRYDKRPAVLTRDLRRDLKRGHPWVFADAVRLPTSARAGDIVTLEARDGRFVASCYVDPDGPLALRVLSTESKPPLEGALRERLAAALALREAVIPATVTGYRIVNGEGDGLPGLVVDRYADVLVIKTDGPIAEAFWDVDAIAADLHERLGVSHVYVRARSRGGAEGYAAIGGEPALTPFREGPATLYVDVVNGQKTGYFLDQREHRLRIGGMARGRRVLNVFGYNGGFSIHAGHGGARHVTTVDIAAPAIAEAERAWLANGLAADAHRGVAVDAFQFLESSDERWELVVLDPPAFAPNRKSLPQALAAYQRLTALGARVTAPGGLMLVASCSAHVSSAELMGAIEEGISTARRRADVIAVGGQPPDHPYPLACPELAYLKAVYLRFRD